MDQDRGPSSPVSCLQQWSVPVASASEEHERNSLPLWDKLLPGKVSS